MAALELAWLRPCNEMEPAPQAGAETREPVLVAPAPERDSILNVVVPADGTRAATAGNGDFGTSPIFGQLSGKPAACLCSSYGVWGPKHNAAREMRPFCKDGSDCASHNIVIGKLNQNV